MLDAIKDRPSTEIADYLASADPSPRDEAHRLLVSLFLTEAGKDAEAARWFGGDTAQTEVAEAEHSAQVLRLVGVTPRPAPARAVASRPTINFADFGG